MNTLANNRFLNSSLAVGGVLLTAGLCISYAGFLKSFIDYITGMCCNAFISTSHYLHIVPVH